MGTGETLFAAVCRAVTTDGECKDEAVLGAFVDWLQEQEFESNLCLSLDRTYEFYLTLDRDGFGHLNAGLRGRTVNELLVCLDDLGPGSGFAEWLVRSIGLDYYLDWK